MHHASCPREVWLHGRVPGVHQFGHVFHWDIAHSDNCRQRIESKMRQDAVDKARLKESKRKRQEFVSRHPVSDKNKHARVELDDGGKTYGGHQTSNLDRRHPVRRRAVSHSRTTA